MPKCKILRASKEICYIRFADGKIRQSSDYFDGRWHLPDGTELILDFDLRGAILGIELIGNNKPCQNHKMRK